MKDLHLSYARLGEKKLFGESWAGDTLGNPQKGVKLQRTESVGIPSVLPGKEEANTQGFATGNECSL